MEVTPLYTTIKIRLYPTQDQVQPLHQNTGNARFVYNFFLAAAIEFYQMNGRTCSRTLMSSHLTELKYEKSYEWLQISDSQALQQSLIDLERAYSNFFRRVREGGKPGFPRFKRKQEGYGSFRITANLRVEGNYIKLGKLGWYKFRCSSKDLKSLNEIDPRSITVRQEAGLWYAMILFECEEQSKVKHVHEHQACGIDLGIVKPLQIAYIDGEGEIRYAVTGPKAQERLKRKELRRKRYQRKLARKVKGSNNFKKCKKRLQRAFLDERNARKDFVEKTSTKIARTFKVVKVENLDLKKLTRKVSSSKNDLNRELLRLGISSLFTRVEQKQSKYGGELIRVDHRNTSRQCSSCGSISKRNRKSQAKFHCTSCGHRQNADRNAAINILFREAA